MTREDPRPFVPPERRGMAHREGGQRGEEIRWQLTQWPGSASMGGGMSLAPGIERGYSYTRAAASMSATVSQLGDSGTSWPLFR
jgi:hypothetical protein